MSVSDNGPWKSIFSCQEKLQQRAKEGKPVFEDYRWIRNPGDTSTLAPGEETRCLEDIVSSNQLIKCGLMVFGTKLSAICLNRRLPYDVWRWSNFSLISVFAAKMLIMEEMHSQGSASLHILVNQFLWGVFVSLQYSRPLVDVVSGGINVPFFASEYSSLK